MGVPCIQAASFDCSKANSATEKLICGNASLSDLDTSLAKLYFDILHILPDQDAAYFKKSEEQWLRNIRDGCLSHSKPFEEPESCLSLAYKQRSKDLSETISKIGPFQITYIVLYSDHAAQQASGGVEGSDRSTSKIRYPRITNTNNILINNINNTLDISKDLDRDDCRDYGGELYENENITFITKNLISFTFDKFTYCSGAAHGEPSIVARNYRFSTVLQPLQSSDLFKPDKQWQAFLFERCFAQIQKNGLLNPQRFYTKESAQKYEKLMIEYIKEIVVDPNHWSLQESGLKILEPFAFNDYPIDHEGDDIIIPWSDLRGMLNPELGITEGMLH